MLYLLDLDLNIFYSTSYSACNSLRFKSRLNKISRLTARVSIESPLFDYLAKETFIAIDEDESTYLYFITDYTRLEDETGTWIDIAADSPELFLKARRYVPLNPNDSGKDLYSDYASNIIKDVAHVSVGALAGPYRYIPFIVIEGKTNYGPIQDLEVGRTEVYTEIVNLTKNTGVDFWFEFNKATKQLLFRSDKRGEDKTFTGGTYKVVFRKGMGNLMNPEYSTSGRNLTTVYIVGTGSGNEQTVVEYDISTNPVLRVEDVTNANTSEDDTDVFDSIGREQIGKGMEDESFEFEIPEGSMTRYGEHFVLGDWVSIVDEEGTLHNMRIDSIDIAYTTEKKISVGIKYG